MRYKFRYPEEYEVFKDRKALPDWVTPDQLTLINEYDNAVRYNDHVVSTLIERLGAAGGKTLMAYFSDHGEDVFDTPPHDFVGRNEAKPTVPMYAVPFFVWRSEAWKTKIRNHSTGTTTARINFRTSSIPGPTWPDCASRVSMPPRA